MRRFPPHVRRTQDNKIWLWTAAVDHSQAGILGWVLGDRAKTFQPLWELVGSWKCYFYVIAASYINSATPHFIQQALINSI